MKFEIRGAGGDRNEQGYVSRPNPPGGRPRPAGGRPASEPGSSPQTGTQRFITDAHRTEDFEKSSTACTATFDIQVRQNHFRVYTMLLVRVDQVSHHFTPPPPNLVSCCSQLSHLRTYTAVVCCAAGVFSKLQSDEGRVLFTRANTNSSALETCHITQQQWRGLLYVCR